jgi:hypothetical protein
MTLEEELALELGTVVTAAVLPPAAPLAAVTPATVHPHAAQWAKWRDRFAEAMDGSFQSIDGLEQLVFQNKVQLWPGKNCAIITEIVTYVGGEKAIQGLWAAGDVAEVLELIPGAEAYGRLMGCTSVLIEGRAGWARALKVMGYQPWSVTVRKAL